MAKDATPAKQFKTGTRIRTTSRNHEIDDWTIREKKARKWQVTGIVVRPESKRASCYLIRHDDGSSGCYDSSELEKLPTSRNQIVCLLFANNRCYTNVTSQLPKELGIDLQNGTWTWREKTYILGARNHNAKYDGSRLIGVYDRTNDNHLGYMVQHGHEARSD